jgi:hypothetical protein
MMSALCYYRLFSFLHSHINYLISRTSNCTSAIQGTIIGITITLSSIVFLISTIMKARASLYAYSVRQDFTKGDVNSAGGWSLSQASCLADALECGGFWRCPSSLTCVWTGTSDITEACCPGSVSLSSYLPFLCHFSTLVSREA